MNVHWEVGAVLGSEHEPPDSAPQEGPAHPKPPCALLPDPCSPAPGPASAAPPALAPLRARQAWTAQVGTEAWAPPVQGPSR